MLRLTHRRIFDLVCEAESADGLLFASAARPHCPGGVEPRTLLVSATPEEVVDWTICVCGHLGILNREDLSVIFLPCEPAVIGLSMPQWLKGALAPSTSAQATLESPLIRAVFGDVDIGTGTEHLAPADDGAGFAMADAWPDFEIAATQDVAGGGSSEGAVPSGATDIAGDRAAAEEAVARVNSGAGADGASTGLMSEPRELEAELTSFALETRRNGELLLAKYSSQLAALLEVDLKSIKLLIDANPSRQGIMELGRRLAPPGIPVRALLR